jgi:hypothetical protein
LLQINLENKTKREIIQTKEPCQTKPTKEPLGRSYHTEEPIERGAINQKNHKEEKQWIKKINREKDNQT